MTSSTRTFLRQDSSNISIGLSRSLSAEDGRKISVSLSRSESAQRRAVLLSPKILSTEARAGAAKPHVMASRSPSPVLRSEISPSPACWRRVQNNSTAPKEITKATEASPSMPTLLLQLRRRASLPAESPWYAEEKPEVFRRASLPAESPWHAEEKCEVHLTQTPSPPPRRRSSLPNSAMQNSQSMSEGEHAIPSMSLHALARQETDVSLSPPIKEGARLEDDGVESTISGFSACDFESDAVSSSGSAEHSRPQSTPCVIPPKSVDILAPEVGATIHTMNEDLKRAMAHTPYLGTSSCLDDIAAKLREALSAARTIGLHSDDEFVIQAERAFMLLSQREARAATRDQLARLLEEFYKQCPLRTTNLETMQKWKQDINDALMAARASNFGEADIREAELCRRRVHNRIEDLKGQVRVLCRVRPRSEAEESRGDPIALQTMDDMTVRVDGQETFSFDGVFEPGSQADVFEECRDLVQSAFDGFNVTIFSYGQTGAGKTYTMYGTPCDEGICGRAISEIFCFAESSAPWQESSVSASIVEMYNNDVLDLGSLISGKPRSLCYKSSASVGLRGTGDLIGLAQFPVSTATELKEIFKKTLGNRTVASHKLNSQSSRSHFIFMINIATVNRETGARTNGKIVLCDLAGSERLKRTEPEGVRRKEAIEINKSLTALGSVIEAVVRKQKQTPYRNHKLTQMLQDSIGGTAKTLMIVNCSPTSSNSAETIMTLKFASKVKSITNASSFAKQSGLSTSPARLACSP